MKKTVIFLLFVCMLSLLLHAQTPLTERSGNDASLIFKAIEETGKGKTYSHYKETLADVRWEEAPIECACNFCPEIFCHPEIPEKLRNSLSRLTGNYGLEDYCYKATQKTTTALILRYFYTGFSFEKVEPRLLRTVIVFKDSDTSLKDLTDEMVKGGAVLEDEGIVKKDGNKVLIQVDLKLSGMSIFLLNYEDTTAALIYSDSFFSKWKESPYPGEFVEKCQLEFLRRWISEAKSELQNSGYEFPCRTDHLYFEAYGLGASNVSLRDLKGHLQKINEWKKTGNPRLPALMFLTGSCMTSPVSETEYYGYELDLLGTSYFRDSMEEKTYYSSNSVLKELVSKHPDSKWGERAVIVNAMFGFGECEGWDCAYYKKVIAEFPGFLSKCRDRDALITGTFFLGAAYETEWCSSKTPLVPLVHDQRNVTVLAPEECRLKTIETYRKVLAMDKDGCFTKHIGRVLPMLYLKVCTDANFFVIFID